ncbi:hypothetical protein HY793_00275 [Candidatus Desantisbacteria bacterium]|nr:hypothetical protein [Candidatus Desantisbacteria bacterium]
MTKLLEKVFNRVEMFPQTLQDDIAEQLMEDIEGEFKWDETLAKSHDKLAKLADYALAEFKTGSTKKMGFDEL